LKSFKVYKNICIISDSYVPQKLSAAGMIYNLSQMLVDKNINVTCAFSGIIDEDIKKKYKFDRINFINTNILTSFRNKALILRFCFEISTAIVLAVKCFFYFNKRKDLDLIIWYGPSVFLWIVVKAINFSKKIPVYYILRDIFPDWLISLKVVKNFYIIWLLKKISNPQYTVSDVIGVEASENIIYLNKKGVKTKQIELLPNWPSIVLSQNNKIDYKVKHDFHNAINSAKENNNITFVYIGNSSIAHDYNSLVEFFDNNYELPNFQINIFSKSNILNTITNQSIEQKLWGLVQDYNLPFIFSKVDCGIVSLNRHAKTNNIPGKFVSYTQFCLPIICFASINSSLAKLIIKYDCGVVIDLSLDYEKNWKMFSIFLRDLNKNREYLSRNAMQLFKENFDTNYVATKILTAFD
jgi:hypothetical protein